jgi:BirA family biotin operon repressor/biotin-[acetyl-CoA-carboxylase] ligase
MDIIERHFEILDSTNKYAKEHIREFAHDKITCITSETQTAGYGRFGRPWHSPLGGNIYTTFVFRLHLPALHLISLGQIMTLSFANVLLQKGLHPKVKWPNDVQLSGKKLAGVLSETVFSKETVDVFCGIGINVNTSREELALIDAPATSLQVETGKAWDKIALLKSLQHQFTADLAKFKKEGFTPFHSQFENLLAYRGEKIRCFDGKKEWSGICHSLTDDGQLNLYLPSGKMHTVLSGDIIQL